MGAVRVPVGTEYEVAIGRGLLADPAEQLGSALGQGVERVMVLCQRATAPLADPLVAALRAAGRRVEVVEVPDAEQAKTAAVAERLWGRLGQAGFTRSDALVGVGGGTVTDLAGFVAATWLRGVRVLQVPTTLVGMVDAAIGGKTGINTAQGKNLVGAFHSPVAVWCDLAALATLPRAELVAGMAEVVKHGFIADERIVELLESDPAAACDPAGPVLAELVERSVRVKAQVVAADPREALLREILNYGHTFGHAVELVEDFTWRHGNAVSVGLMYAAELGALAGRTDRALVERHRRVLAGLGLPTTYPAGRWPALHQAMTRDKKARGSRLRFVVLDALARPGRVEDPDPALLEAAYAAVSTS